MSLPVALSRWAEPLSVLDPTLVLALGPLLERLGAALGSLGGESKRGGDEPDGYAGIGRRGKLEQLLTTEWGLLDTAPDEFLRRLSEGELSFLEPERRSSSQDRRCWVLFDVGPEQLGAPRLAQLAAWIVLEQRARAAGATLQWATLDTAPDETTLQNSFTEAGVRAFLWARTVTQAPPRQLYAWRKLADDALGSPDELWLLGGPHWQSVPMARGIHLLTTEETDDGTALSVALRPVRKTLQLPLPPPETQVRLLRDPFTASSAPPGKSRASGRHAVGELVWLPGGKFVCARDSQDQGVLVYPIPTKQGASLGPPKLYQQHYGRIRAIGGHGNAIFVVSRLGDKLETRLVKGSCSHLPTQKLTLTDGDKNLLGFASEELGLATLSSADPVAPQLDVVFTALESAPDHWRAHGTLTLAIGLKERRPERSWVAEIQALRLLSFAETPSQVLRVQATDGASFLAYGANPEPRYWLGKVSRALLFSGPSPRESVVVQRSDGRWYLPLESKEVPFPTLDPDDTLVGATYFGGQVRLVTLSEGGRIVRLIGLGGIKTLTGIGGKLVRAAVSPDLPLLACLRESGDLVLWDLENNARRCQFLAARETFEEGAST